LNFEKLLTKHNSDMCHEVGLTSWGYQACQQGGDRSTIMHVLSHSNLATINRSLSFTDEDMRDVAKWLNLWGE